MVSSAAVGVSLWVSSPPAPATTSPAIPCDFSVSLDADIAAGARQLKKIPFMTGMRLYYSSTLRQLLFGYRQCPWLRFSLEPADPEAPPAETFQRYVLLAITNGPTYGSGF